MCCRRPTLALLALFLGTACLMKAGPGEGEGEGGEGEGEGGEGEGEGEGEDLSTWYGDVLPVARQRCLQCHVQGGIGPVDLEDEDRMLELGPAISGEVAAGSMPPWMPAADCGGHEYLGDLSLSAGERAVFAAWANDGWPLGDPADDPGGELPTLPQLASVSVVLDAGFDYTAPNTLADEYRCFILDPDNADDEHVVGYDIRPGAGEVVHHVILFKADRAAAQARDAEEAAEPGWQCFGSADVDGSSFEDTIAAWAPGAGATTFPAGTGLPLANSEVLVMQVHYNTEAVVTVPPDRTEVALQYAEGPVVEARMVPVLDDDLTIAPGVTDHQEGVSVPNPLTADVYGVLPHMHALGQRITVSAAGACLVDIPSWDFHWQSTYFFAGGPVRVPQLAEIRLSCTYDNNTTELVRFGEGTSDEMCLAYFYFVPNP